jgi:general L-amino acid transport system permease protein
VNGVPKPRLSRAVFLERLPGYVAQAVLAAIIAWLVWRAIVNFQANARALHLSVGFGFLHTQAGFQIGESLIAFGPASTYLDAIIAATLNTLLVIALAGAISTLIGLGVAFGRLGSGAFVRAASSLCVEVFRNIPLLLQILFWYFSAIALLPGLDESIRIGPALLNNRGLFLPALHIDPTFGLERPHVEGFDVVGGFAILPELMALTLGLSIYNGAFLAEIFRAGVLSVPRGQIEAATSVGLSGARAAWLIVLPQALRVALPAAGGQYQTLAKASSLAAAIGYPDLMQIVGGTIASQTSQALEAMTLVILIYAAINLCIALIVGFANRALLAHDRR